jgi:hypothetical protein
MSSKMGLDAMAGLFLTWLGSAVADSQRDKDGVMWFRFSLPPSDQFRQASKKFIEEYNRAYGTAFSIGFPKAYRMTIREGRRSPRRNDGRSARGPSNGQGPAQ